MKMRDRMIRGNPILRALVDRMDALISGHNELVKVVFVGKNPHKANDATNVLTAAVATGADADPVIELAADLRTKYEAHRADTDAHAAADSTNTITATTIQAQITALANELKVDINAHMSNGTAHTNADDVTAQVAAAVMTTKASGITLLNALRAAYEAHRVNLEDVATDPVHGAADATNTVTPAALAVDATYTQMAALADAIRVAYEAHRVLTAGTVHASADSTNTVTATAVGVVQTDMNTLLDELKLDINAHISDGTAHYNVDRTMIVTAAASTSLATSRTLANALRDSYADHITRAQELTAAPFIATLDEV